MSAHAGMAPIPASDRDLYNKAMMEEGMEERYGEGYRHREDVKNSVGRLLFVGISALIQLLWFAFIILRLSESYLWVSAVLRILTIAAVLRIFGRHTNATIKLSWIVFIMATPILGLVFYLLSYRSNFVNTMSKRFRKLDSLLLSKLPDTSALVERLRCENPGVGNQAYFLQRSAGFPLYQDTDVAYYSDARQGLEAQKEALRHAGRFIFMEYHAIEDREAFGELREILTERARAGVEVRIFYDEVGSVGFLTRGFIREMESYGIRCRVFNPIMPLVNLFMNNRDHRKITVIDGRISFTGGYNLADEYFNLTHPYGIWKDSGIRMEGAAVRTMTMLFLEMWNAMDRSGMEDVSKYLDDTEGDTERRGFTAKERDAYILPYADTPLDELHTGEDVYLNVLKNAKYYVYIITPYLIPTDDMVRELTLAARRGVDVRILTPGIPDKPLIYGMTRSYYGALAREGVRLFEYTPGFCHAKQVVADGELAVIGTINFDYRSLYHHFENAVLLYRYACIAEMREDFLHCLEESGEVTARYRDGRSAVLRIGQCVLRLFAPLL